MKKAISSFKDNRVKKSIQKQDRKEAFVDQNKPFDHCGRPNYLVKAISVGIYISEEIQALKNRHVLKTDPKFIYCANRLRKNVETLYGRENVRSFYDDDMLDKDSPFIKNEKDYFDAMVKISNQIARKL